MKTPGVLQALLSFNGGFVDTAGFLGLQGLFAARVTETTSPETTSPEISSRLRDFK
jgi:hypothetical protein